MNALKRKFPLGAVAVLLTVALAALGLVYGNWSQTLSIGGSVSTGSLSANWELPEVFGVPISECTDNEQVKDFGSTSQDPDGKTLNITVENAYPNYGADCEWHLRYTGQVPGVIQSITFKEGELSNCVVTPLGTQGTFLAKCDELSVQWVNSLCTQLFDEDLISGSIIVGVNKDVDGNGPAMKTKYDFGVNVEIVQFDKVDPTICD